MFKTLAIVLISSAAAFGQIVNGGGGGGSGTVNANNGNAGAVANYAAAAGSTTVGPDANLTDASNTLTYTGSGGVASTGAGGFVAGANSGSAGVIALNGSTSGQATCTAPAAAGTVGNPVSCTNMFSTPGYLLVNGTIPGSATGMFNNAAQNVVFQSNGTQWMLGNATQVQMSKPLNASGGNRLFVTGNFTTAANTNLQTITGLQFTHTGSAVNWNFHCALAYSQATANAAVAFGIQAATNAPTNIFATGTQQITVGPPATIVTGILPTLTTTTATNIVSGTPGATATNYTVTLDGTLELAASANTINFMVSTATSGDAVTVLRGSYCTVF